MTTNSEQLKYLKLKVDTLGAKIEALGRSDECIGLIETFTKNPKLFHEITDDEYDSMLVKEQDNNLLLYYCSARFRLQQLEREMSQASKSGTLKAFLNSTYIQATLTVGGLAALAETMYHVIKALGLGAHDDGGQNIE
jgi:hypothetical protein